MPNVKDILSLLFEWAPVALAWERDNVGLLIGSETSSVRKVLVTLDVTHEVVDEALSLGVNLLVSHHPVIFHPVRNISRDTTHGALLHSLVKHDIAVIAMHTNADAASLGVNVQLAERLELRDIRPLRTSHMMVLLRVHHRAGHEEVSRLVRWLKSQGARTYYQTDNGESSLDIHIPVWQEKQITGYLRTELKEQCLDIASLKLSNPVPDFGMGAVGTLPEEMSRRSFLEHVTRVLDCGGLRYSAANPSRSIYRVAVCGGAGSSLLPEAIAAGADALVTSDLTYHMFLDRQREILLVDAGHYETELVFVDGCTRYLRQHLFDSQPKIDILPTGTVTNPVRFF